MKKALLIILLVCLGMYTYSQEIKKITGIILDIDTQEPVIYASIVNLDNQRIGTTSDKNGCFRLFLEDISQKNRYYISALGYHDTILILPDDKSQIIIYLKPAVFQLQEVVIESTPLRKKTIGSKRYRIRKIEDEFAGFGFFSPGWSNGVYVIPSNTQKNAILSSIDFFIADTGILNSIFLIRILIPKVELEENKLEDISNFYDYLDTHIVFRATNRGWMTIDLLDKEIILPKDPFIILFTPLDEGEQFYWTNRYGYKQYGAVIASYERLIVPRLYWIFRNDDKLAYFCRRNGARNVPAVVLNYLE